MRDGHSSVKNSKKNLDGDFEFDQKGDKDKDRKSGVPLDY